VKKNYDRSAMRFASATYIPLQAMLDVTFENGDHLQIAAEMAAPKANTGRAEWSKMRIAETGDVLEVPAGDEMIEIPWDRIRSLGDPEFREHLSQHARVRAKRIGARVRAMRVEAGISPGALAQKVGLSANAIADLESGKTEPQTDVIEHIALALGRRLRDLAEE
jgi:DNA-binding XRE family transcriptional regulator